MGSHSYLNRKPGGQTEMGGYTSAPNTGKKRSVQNLKQSNIPGTTESTPVYNASQNRIINSGGNRLKQSNSEMNMGIGQPNLPPEYQAHANKRNIMSNYTSKTNSRMKNENSSDLPSRIDKLEAASQRYINLGPAIQENDGGGYIEARSMRVAKQETVSRFIQRQQSKIKEKQHQSQLRETIEGKPELFAEKFSKFSVRDYSNNTRMNIKNQDYANMRNKRDRAINYW